MNFDLLAPHYDWLEAVTAGSRLQRVRTQWLDALSNRENVLSVGEGHGRFAAAFTERFPTIRLTCVESSAGMSKRAKLKIGNSSAQVAWIQEDFLSWKMPHAYDAIVTCFFLDCFPPETLAAVIAKLASHATGDALWLLADFSIPERGLARYRARFVHGLMYTFFRAVTKLPARQLVCPADLLQTHGFRCVERRDFEWGLLRASLWRRSLNAE